MQQDLSLERAKSVWLLLVNKSGETGRGLMLDKNSEKGLKRRGEESVHADGTFIEPSTLKMFSFCLIC